MLHFSLVIFLFVMFQEGEGRPLIPGTTWLRPFISCSEQVVACIYFDKKQNKKNGKWKQAKRQLHWKAIFSSLLCFWWWPTGQLQWKVLSSPEADKKKRSGWYSILTFIFFMKSRAGLSKYESSVYSANACPIKSTVLSSSPYFL